MKQTVPTTFTDDGIYEQDIRCGNGATAKFMDLVTTQTLAERLDPTASACISWKLWSIW